MSKLLVAIAILFFIVVDAAELQVKVEVRIIKLTN